MTTPCNTSTNIDIQTCYGHGNCSFDAGLNAHRCVCDRPFQSELDCSMTRWAYFAGVDVAFYTIFAIPMLFVSLLLIPEIIIDIKLRRHISWKTPTRVSKIALLLYMLPRTVYMGYSDIYEAAAHKSANSLASEILILLWSLGLAITYPLVCIGWLGVVLKAKNLGVSSKGLKRFRLAIFIILCIIIPLYSCLLMVPFGLKGKVKDSSIFVIGSYVVELSYILFLIIGTTYFTFKVLIWAKKGASESDVLRVIAKKTIHLTVANVALIALFVILAVKAVLEDVKLRGDLTIDLFNCATDAISGVAFFLFLQNYFLSKHGFMRGYYLGFSGKLSKDRTLGLMKRKTGSTDQKQPRTVESAKRRSTANNKTSIPSSTGSTFTLNAASSAATTSQNGEDKEFKSRVTHSYESSSIVDSDKSSSSSISSSQSKVTKEELEPKSKENDNNNTNSSKEAKPESPTEGDQRIERSTSRSFSFEVEDSGSQSSFIFNLFKS